MKIVIGALIFVFMLGGILAPANANSDAVFSSAQVCAECHVDNHRNWRNSLHALSFKNAIFQTAYREAYTKTGGEAKKYCLNCHAPTVRVTEDYDALLPITQEGVTCDFCHTVSEINLENENPFTSSPGNVKRSVLKGAQSPHHKTEYSEDFASSKLCAGCHSFKNRHGIRVGDTYNEWKSSPFAKEGKQCQSCHMQEIKGKTANEGGRNLIHDHSLSHNLASMKDAVRVKVTKIEKTANRIRISVDMKNERVGHTIPTGTPQRHLILEVRTYDSSGSVIETLRKKYHKTIVDSDGKEIFSDGDVFLYGVKIVSDNRLKSQETRSEMMMFSKRIGSVVKVSAEVYFLYQPIVTERATMRIPINSTNSKVK